MLAVIELEVIGDNYFAYQRQAKQMDRYTERYAGYFGRDKSRPWVARLTGLDPQFGFKREFIRAQQKDYGRANSIGSRGIYLYFVLAPGLYEVHARETWKRTRRYFVRVEDTQITEIEREEVIHCLKPD